MAQPDENLLKKVISHAKEYGFIFPSSEIYDGLQAVYDYGQNGVELKNNIKEYWWRFMTRMQDNIVGIDTAIFMHPTVWKASGHVDAFNDPMIDSKDSRKRYRADALVEDAIDKRPANELLQDLQVIESRVADVSVPLSYADELYALRSNIQMVRRRLGAADALPLPTS